MASVFYVFVAVAVKVMVCDRHGISPFSPGQLLFFEAKARLGRGQAEASDHRR